MDTWKLWDIIGEVLKYDVILFILLCIINFGHCKMDFMYITLHVWVVLKSQYSFVADDKQFSANKISNTGVTIMLSSYSMFLPVVYVLHRCYIGICFLFILYYL